ncbi:MAG: 50S ribosomal protein L11 methyltransferase [Eubacteriales bacterium]|nr:50S ribosomal protein L11 methyltransferase [Eubacteriales bacterium]
MKWIEVTVESNAQGADIITEQFHILGVQGAQVIDGKDIPTQKEALEDFELLDENIKRPPEGVVLIRAWLHDEQQLETIKNTLSKLPKITGIDLGTLEVKLKVVVDDDWKDKWKEDFKTLHIGKRFVIKPSWENYTAQNDEIVIEIDPGLAFGTGLHETTAMCLTLIEEKLKGGSLLDIGTGSGILSIAAAKLGATNVLGIDRDNLAVEAAENNIKINNVEDKVKISMGDLAKGINTRFDLVVSNILAEAIVQLIPSLSGLLNKNGFFIASGIVRDKEGIVIESLEQHGFMVEKIMHKADWTAIVAYKEDELA